MGGDGAQQVLILLRCGRIGLGNGLIGRHCRFDEAGDLLSDARNLRLFEIGEDRVDWKDYQPGAAA